LREDKMKENLREFEEVYPNKQQTKHPKNSIKGEQLKDAKQLLTFGQFWRSING